MSLCASVYMYFVVTCWERADLLALVCDVYCEFVIFPLVSWVRCGTRLYRFLIFATLHTFMLCLWSGPPGFNCWIFFYSGIQLYVLLSRYLCVISFLYLDLHLLGDDTSISYGSFMRTKHIFVLIHARNKGEVGTMKLF